MILIIHFIEYAPAGKQPASPNDATAQGGPEMPDRKCNPRACDVRGLTPLQWTDIRRSATRWAHAERGRMIRALAIAAVAGVRTWCRRIREHEQARADLRAMNDHELRDIGVNRLAIEAAITRQQASPAHQTWTGEK
jgi:uncharacterized protein YjiS (DUF1127 family)